MRVQRFHTYQLAYANLGVSAGSEAAGGSATDSFLVETAYDFWWLKAQAFISTFATGQGIVTTTLPLLTVLMQDGSSQQQLSNEAVPIAAQFGTGEIPYILPQPHIIAGGATFNATVTNLATTAYSVRLLFSGVHVAKGQAPGQRGRIRGR